VNEQLKKAKDFFYKKDYLSAKDIFLEMDDTYGAGLCFLLMGDFSSARKYFQTKENDCTASSFGLVVLDILEDKPKKNPTYFQVRCFLEIYINLFIENNMFNFAQKLIDNYGFFTNVNFETPKFIARVLNANDYNNSVHFFAQRATEVCTYDAEIYYIDALVYIKEKNLDEAKKCIKTCLSFAPDYYPIKKLQSTIEKMSA